MQLSHEPPSVPSADGFVRARRQLLRWREAGRRALLVVEFHFPKSNPLRKNIAALSGGLEQFRFQADAMACRFGDVHGDHVLRQTIDGVYLHSPVDYFYGQSLREHEDAYPQVKISPVIAHDKTLNIFEISCLHALEQRAAAFMAAVKQLPPGARTDSAANRRILQCEKTHRLMFERILRRLQNTRVDHSKTYVVLICLNRAGLPAPLGKLVIDCIV